MTLHPQSETSKLPVSLAPELLLAVHSDKGPLIADIAPRLASWTGHPVAELVGQPLDAVFHEVIPELPVVVEEVLHSGRPVHDYRLTRIDHDGVQRTMVLQAGLSPGSPGQQHRLVGVRLEELPRQASTADEVRAPQSFHGLLGQAPAFVRMLRKIGALNVPIVARCFSMKLVICLYGCR